MDYEAAITMVREGKHVRRATWDEPRKFLTLGENIDKEDYPTGVVYSVELADNTYYFPWQPDAEDMSASDWEETEWMEPEW